MDTLIELFAQTQGWLFESLVQPLMFAMGMGGFLDQGYAGTGWFLVGLLQLAVILLVIGPLERWRPVEAVTDHATVRTDMLYTLIHRLGVFRLVMFFTLDPWVDSAVGVLRAYGLPTLQLDDLWPGLTDLPWVSMVVYLVVFDFLNYWFHRAQHHFDWWWQLHALHHAQRQMTMWSDNRNHLLDDVLIDLLLVLAALAIGVAPGQFVAIIAIAQLSESLQHANLKVWFGPWGERLFVSPRFHRLHHSIGIGHESHPGGPTVGRPVLGGHNFGVLFPWWDLWFGTADFTLQFAPTGVRNQVDQGVNYGQGFWSQQWQGFKRLWSPP
ncbi:MAG: sterol desaturase family protein [Rhodoferax sp.]|nr:sterol desaturase family protein [Rhodoferax sp.]